jgi:tetratricopeptide (TPR) repeat protein
MSHFNEAVRLAPNDPSLHFSLANCYLEGNVLDKALYEYMEVLRLDRLHPGGVSQFIGDRSRLTMGLVAMAHFELAIVYSDKDLCDNALAECEEALKLVPGWPDGCCLRSEIFQKMGRTHEALASVKEALRIDPNSGKAHAILSSQLLETRQLYEALASANEAICLAPHEMRGYEAAGDALIAMRQVDEGFAIYMQVFRMSHKQKIRRCEHTYRRALEVLEKYHVDKDVQERFSREVKAIMESKPATADQESKTNK